MDLQKQIALIKAHKPVENLERDELMTVFERVVYLFRRYIGPLTDPAQLAKNLPRIMVLCRLDGDDNAIAHLLAARAVAQIDGSAKSGNHNDLLSAAGLDITNASDLDLGTHSARCVLVNPDNDPKDSFVLTFRGERIVILGGASNGSQETSDLQEACKIIDRLNVRGGGQRNVELDYGTFDVSEDVEIFDTVHDPWRPSTVYSNRLKAHPTPIIEPSTLAATTYPTPTYKPLLPLDVIERGHISDAQYECITYCLQAVTALLPGSPLGPRGPLMKGGFIIGDGTGVGKTNEFCGVIMDQWLRGLRRHIIVVERAKHVQHIMDAWEMIGGNPRNIMYQGDRSASEELPSRDGIMVTSYPLIRDPDRYNALIAWANESEVMNGILVFDEAHNMRNAVEDQHDEGSGKRNQSQQGVAGLNLQNDLPRAGVIYASATMATDVYNLGYAQRLGLWGEDAPFTSSANFINEMYNLDEAALEQICIDLKSAGRYCSRTLSFDGVEYEELEHILTPRQKERFDQVVTSWRTYSKMVKAAMAACTNNKYAHDTRFNDAVRVQRDTIEALLTNFSVETLIEDMHEEIARGNSPVVQISMTGEARMKRIIGKRKEMTLSEYQDDSMIAYIEEHFPIHKRVKTDKKWEIAVDNNNNPIEVPEAVRLRDQALEMAKKVSLDMSALDHLLLEFGSDSLAEMTGRSLRVLPVMRQGVHEGWTVEDRPSGAAVADVNAFQDGRKTSLVFSLSAGGTGLSYHSEPGRRNTARRIHYILELGRRAESAVQGIGRTHRSGQIEPPIVKMVKSDLPADMIYTSKTLAKIQKMGALSRGHQHATTNAIFEQRIPLHSIYAARGWESLVSAIQRKEIEGVTEEQLCQDLGIEQKDLKNFNIALSRLAILTDGEQRYLVEELRNRTDEAISAAVRNGSYNQGLETIRAESIEIIDQNEIINANGSKTMYYRLVRHDKIDRTTFSQAMVLLSASRMRKNVKAVFMRHKISGRIVLGIAQENGMNVDITSPAGTLTRRLEAVRSEPWKVVSDIEEAKRSWEQEYENMDLEETSELHMLSGSLLYNWNKLPKIGIGLTRCKVKSGEVIVGRLIPKSQIKSTLQDLGMQSNYAPAQIATMLRRVDQGAILEMNGGWSIDLPTGETEYRLNVPDAEQNGQTRRMLQGMGVQEVITPLGNEYTIPKSEAFEIIRKLAIGSDLSLTGVVAPSAANTQNSSTASLAAMIAP